MSERVAADAATSGRPPDVAAAERDNLPDRLSLRLSPEARKTLEEIAALRGGASLAEVVRRALGTELFLIREQNEGSRILLERPDKTVRQIVLR
jgi:hypothetical protein